jgi:hypothetical protein
MNNETTLSSNETRKDEFCRLCHGNLAEKFRLNILHKYNISYFQCKECHSLQSENPFWISEAYELNLSHLDTGAAQRNINNFVRTLLICKFLKINNILDVGGGDGLLCRLLRDYQINCFSQDKYAKSIYAQGFNTPDFITPQLILAFELIEHFVNPTTDLKEIFCANTKYILLSTGIYRNQDENWWYLSPESGQHIFFYSLRALNYIGENFGYQYFRMGGFILFYQPKSISPLGRLFLRVLNRFPLFNIAKALVFLWPAQGYWKDHLALKDMTDKK